MPREKIDNRLRAVAAMTEQGQGGPAQRELLRRRELVANADARAARAVAMPPNVDPRVALNAMPAGLETRMARIAAIQGPAPAQAPQAARDFDPELLAAIQQSRENNQGMPVAFVDDQGKTRKVRGAFQFGLDQSRDRRLEDTDAIGATPERQMANNRRTYVALQRANQADRADKVATRGQDQGAQRQAALGNPFALARRAGDPETANALIASMVSHASGADTLNHINSIKETAEKQRAAIAANTLAKEVAAMTDATEQKKEANRHTEKGAEIQSKHTLDKGRLDFEKQQHSDTIALAKKKQIDENDLAKIAALTDQTTAANAARDAENDAKLKRMMADPDYLELQNPSSTLTPEERSRLRRLIQVKYADVLGSGKPPTPEQIQKQQQEEENTGGADVGEQHLIQGKITPAAKKKLKEHLDNIDFSGWLPDSFQRLNDTATNEQAQEFADQMIKKYPKLLMQEAALKDAYHNWNRGTL